MTRGTRRRPNLRRRSRAGRLLRTVLRIDWVTRTRRPRDSVGAGTTAGTPRPRFLPRPFYRGRPGPPPHRWRWPRADVRRPAPREGAPPGRSDEAKDSALPATRPGRSLRGERRDSEPRPQRRRNVAIDSGPGAPTTSDRIGNPLPAPFAGGLPGPSHSRGSGWTSQHQAAAAVTGQLFRCRYALLVGPVRDL
ncbi:hypothetical protein V1278_000218 [Bradyrhizobium sp. AZCC 1577]